MRSSLLGCCTARIGFGTNCWPHLQASSRPRRLPDPWPIGCPQTSVTTGYMSCVTSQKSEDRIYTVAESWNHVQKYADETLRSCIACIVDATTNSIKKHFAVQATDRQAPDDTCNYTLIPTFDINVNFTFTFWPVWMWTSITYDKQCGKW